MIDASTFEIYQAGATNVMLLAYPKDVEKPSFLLFDAFWQAQ